MDRPLHGPGLADAIRRDTGITSAALLDAFAAIPRERFLGPPPWLIAKSPSDGMSSPAYEETSDLAAIYANVSVALDADRQLFNGAPGVVAGWLDALHLQRGDRVFHVGCGSGYYSAIAAELAGPRGSVIAFDVDDELVDRAGDALADLENVSVMAANGLTFAPRTFDAMLINTGVTVIPEAWLTSMNRNGGRIAVPLTVPMPARPGQSHLSKGLVFLIERSEDVYSARVIGGAIIFTAAGAADDSAQRLLWRSLSSADAHDVRSLRRDSHEPDGDCWLHERRYCLSRLNVACAV